MEDEYTGNLSHATDRKVWICLMFSSIPSADGNIQIEKVPDAN
ncbi:uncharacterized protein RCO7_14502 [Rhynchosporium graminicola]|uniref:Uncharacterized protein n=2 Tax=Rhynchosporium TaxID=38037 RepID=A0A1E1MEZ2_RHYSE|nr:uncharacterized protein RCO7_14502 [Rhynchosporium commune]CZT47656.1 uncharacterized protein RSE6_08242 [Rhynchosporium secalis]